MLMVGWSKDVIKRDVCNVALNVTQSLESSARYSGMLGMLEHKKNKVGSTNSRLNKTNARTGVISQHCNCVHVKY